MPSSSPRRAGPLKQRRRRSRRGYAWHGRAFSRLFFEQLEERALLTAELVSVTPSLTAGALTSTNPAISAIGRYVAFQSRATDLVAGFSDTNGGEDVFVRDLMLDTTVLISRVGARAGDGKSFDPDISDSGRFVTFASFATDLAPGMTDDNGLPDVFIHDRDSDADGVFDEPGATRTALLSVSFDGTSGTGASGAGPLGAEPFVRPVISGDGRFVTFGTLAPDLALIDPTPDDGPLIQFNGVDADVIKARVADGALELVSINVDLTGTGVGPAGAGASSPSISRDGSRVAFESRATTLVDPLFFDDSPPFPPAQVYVGAGSSGVELVSVTPDGMEIGDEVSREPVISRDGRHVAFISKATDLVAGATNTNGFAEDVFVRDLKTLTTTLVSRSRAVPGPITTGDGASPGVPGFGVKFTGGPAISDTGRFIAFRSDATNLLDPALGVADTNGLPDIFVFDRDADLDGVFDEVGATTTVLVSVNSAGTGSVDVGGGFCSSFAPSLSRDGRLVAFNSTCEDLVPGVSGTNVYVRDLVSRTTTLISATTSGVGGGVVTAAGLAREVVISNSGTRVAFISDTIATVLDPMIVADANLGTDVFAGTPPPDIRSSASKADGLTTGVLSYGVFFDSAAPFEIGFYRSTDGVFDPSDELLGTIPISDPDDLSIGSHPLTYSIGSGAGEIALPGSGGSVAESDEDYFVLLVADHEDVVVEFDGVPFAEDNTGYFSVGYHEPGGPVFIHGRERDTARRSADTITATTTATALTVTYGGAITGATTYPLADVTGLRIRTHSGDDTVIGSDLPDFIHGGDGKDVLDGAGGDDMVYGGPGDDTLTGGAGADTFFDGCGDDTVSDLDPASGDTYMVTPCSADVFTDNGGSDTLNFSLAARAINVHLWSQAIQTVDSTGSTLRLNGQWENFVGSPFDDTVSVRPLPVAQNLMGGDGLGDRLIFDAQGLNVTFDGTTFMIPGHGDVTIRGFEEIQTINAAPRIIDNSDPGYSEVGGWFASDPNFQQGFNGGVRFNAAGTGNDVATWNFTNLPPGQYMVSGTWTFAGDRAKISPFEILDGGPTGPIAASLAVNQEQNPGEFDPPEDGQNILFRNLAEVIVTGHELTVQLTDNADQFVAADAIRIETMDPSNLTVPTQRPFTIIDDEEIGFSSTCAPDILANNAANRGAFGDRYRCTNASDVTTWDFGTVPPGKYLLETTWTPDPLNPASADYELHVGSDVFNFNVNQQQAPNGIVAGNIPWQVLGQVEVDPLNVLEALLNGEGVADAVRLRPASDIEVKTTSLTGQGQLCMKGCIITLTHNAPDRRVFSKLDVKNTGSAELKLDPVMVTGTGFSVAAGFGATSLPPGGSTEFEIAFDPTGLGLFSGDIVFGNNAFGLNPFDFSIDVNVVADTTPPTVQLVPPPGQAEVSEVIEGTKLGVGAEAMDDLGGIDRVEFLVDGQVVATDTVFPFEIEIQVPTGVTQVMLGARAVDQAGNTGDSLPVVLGVLPDQPPVISCAPPSGSFFAVGPTTVTCTATDDVLVERVEFLANGQVFQTVTEEPYVAQFDVPAGVNSFVLQSRAIDSGGRIDLVDITLSVFGTPIMTNTSTVVGSDGFSTNDSDDPGAFLVEPWLFRQEFNLNLGLRYETSGSDFRGGVRVATGDVNGDRVPDIITGAGTGASGGHVKVFSGVDGSELRSFFAFPGFAGGVTVAGGDFNSDGFDDIIVGAGVGATGGHVKVFSGQTGIEIRSFFAFPGFAGGVTVAGGDVNGDGFDDIIVGAGATGGHVKAFSGQTGAEIDSFFAFPGFTGGVFVAGGDVNSDGFDDIIVGAGPGATGGHVKVFDGATSTELDSFFAYPGFTGGVRVATGDFNNDGTPDIITGPGSGTGPQVKVFDGITLDSRDDFFAHDAGFTGGVFVSGVASPPVTVIPLPPGGGVFEVIGDNNDVVVRQQGGGEVFRGPQANNPRLRIDGPPNVNDRLIVNLNGLTTAITFDGGEGGNDALRLDETLSRAFLKHQFLGPADGLVVLDPGVAPSVVKFFHARYLGLEPIEDNLAVVDRVFTFPDTDDNILLNTGDSAADSILRIDSNNSEVVDFQQPTGSLTIESASNDTADIGAGWTFEDTEVVDGRFARILKRNTLILRMIGPRDWSNPINPLDVNASNSIEPQDVLNIINELNNPRFHNADGSLASAAGLAVFPGFFYDSSPDGFVVPLDALVIINFLNNLGGPVGEANDVSRPPLPAGSVHHVFSLLSNRDPPASSRNTTNNPRRQQIATLSAPSPSPTLASRERAARPWHDRGNSLSKDKYIDALDRLLGEPADEAHQEDW